MMQSQAMMKSTIIASLTPSGSEFGHVIHQQVVHITQTVYPVTHGMRRDPRPQSRTSRPSSSLAGRQICEAVNTHPARQCCRAFRLVRAFAAWHSGDYLPRPQIEESVYR